MTRHAGAGAAAAGLIASAARPRAPVLAGPALAIGGEALLAGIRCGRAAANAAPTDPGLRGRLGGSLARAGSGMAEDVRDDGEYSVMPTLRIGALLRYDRMASRNGACGLVFARARVDR